MASAGGTKTMTFFAFSREIRDLIYASLTPKNKTFTIISRNAFSTSEPDLGIINASKAVQHEMLEALCPNNTFKLPLPRSDNRSQAIDRELAALIIHFEIHIDFGHMHWERFRVGRDDSEIHDISEQVCDVLSVWNRYSIKRESCSITINDNTRFISPLLQLPFFQVAKTLVELETLLIIVLKFKPDLWRLGAFLAPSLGPSTVLYEWPLLDSVKWDYGSIKFHPRSFLAEGLQ